MSLLNFNFQYNAPENKYAKAAILIFGTIFLVGLGVLYARAF